MHNGSSITVGPLGSLYRKRMRRSVRISAFSKLVQQVYGADHVIHLNVRHADIDRQRSFRQSSIPLTRPPPLGKELHHCTISIFITSFSVDRTPSNARRIAYRHFRSLCPTRVNCTSVQIESSTLGGFLLRDSACIRGKQDASMRHDRRIRRTVSSI